MVAKTYGIGLKGLEAFLVEVEADKAKGLPAYEIVGLPDTSVKESRDRVQAAIRNSGLENPVSRITVNLAPANRPKDGPSFDLPILVSILTASGQLRAKIDDCVFIGELSLSGTTRPVPGILSMVLQAKKEGFHKVFLPAQNANEGAIVDGIKVYPVADVASLVRHLHGAGALHPAVPQPGLMDVPAADLLDYADVRGQEEAKRALEIAASGGHNLLMIGPPGSGKSMLAKRLPSILPDMTFSESLETTMIYSCVGKVGSDAPLMRVRPFRAPHHTVSTAGLSGGSSNPKPGEVSLAHNGVLFLDELPEFSRSTMEILRQPIEDGVITIARAKNTVTYPCNLMLIAAMNPCPCGFFGHPTRSCTCSGKSVSKYLGRISGPLLDRLDLHVEVPPVEFSELTSQEKSECSADIKKRVAKARSIQQARYSGTDCHANANLPASMLHEVCCMTEQARAVLKRAFERFGLSARAYDRILKVSRTIADLDSSEVIGSTHIAEAVQYRNLDRKYWLNEL